MIKKYITNKNLLILRGGAMIGNDRLYLAVQALATGEKDARARVCVAMSILRPLRQQEFMSKPEVWRELQIIKRETSYKGPQKFGEKVLKDSYEHTAIGRKNKTYSKIAKKIFDLWILTTDKS